MLKKAAALAVVVTVLVAFAVSCTPTTQVVEKIVKETVVVEKEVPITVKETVIVEKEVAVKEEVIVEKEVVVVVTATPEPGGDMIIAMDGESEPALLDAQIDPYLEAGLISSFLTDSLVCRDPKTKEFKPWLAESWEVSDDNLVWTFHLREGVTFHDGTPWNAEAAKYNFDRILSPETMSVEAAARLGPVTSVEVVDEYTLQFTHEYPYGAFLDAFGILMEPMWSPKALAEYGLDDFANHLVGTGPFIFKENVPKDHVTVVKNPDYNWAPDCVDHDGPVNLESFTFKWVTEPAVRGGLMETGEVHGVSLPAQYVGNYADNPDYQLVVGYPGGTGLNYVMNTVKPPFDDVRVRKAVLHAVERQSMNQMLYDGLYLVSYGPNVPGSTCYWEGMEDMYPYDLDAANALLDEAGWVMNPATGIREKDGEPLSFRWTALHHEEIGEVLQAQLKMVGMDVKPEKVAGPVQIDMTTRRDFELMYERQRGTDPMYLELLFHSKEKAPGGWNWSGWSSERVDELFDMAQGEGDFDTRCGYLEEVQQIVMEDAVSLGIFGQPVFWVLDKSVKGFALGSLPNYYFPYNLEIEK